MEHRQLAYRAGLVCLVGGSIQIVYGILAILFPYPRILEGQFEFLFLLANAGMIGGFIGLLALDAGRPRPLALCGGALAIIGHSIRVVLSAMLIFSSATPGDGSMFNLAIPVSITFMFLGLGLLGIATVRGKRLTGWHAWTPLLVLGASIVTAVTFAIDKHIHFIFLGLLGGLPWMLVGFLVFQHARNGAPSAQVLSPRAAATP